MILKNEILQAAKYFNLEPTTVEKDYVLGWVLFGISQHKQMSDGRRINGIEPIIEQIRYAARNRMCIKIEYDGVIRKVEPYSLRHPRTGNTLFYGYELERDGTRTDHIKAYKINSLSIVEITQDTFVPRYVIEF